MLALLASLVFLALGTDQSHATPPPNLEAVMRGVAPTLMNIFHQPNPGIKNQIFKPVRTSSSSSQADTLNSFVNVEAANKCTPEMSVERVQNYNEFKEALSLIFSCDTETDGAKDVAASWLHSAGKATCSRENFREELAMQQFFKVIGGEIFLVTAKCTTHTVSINPFEPPVFTPTFQRAIQILDHNYKSPNDKSTEQVFLEFVKLYGTHFSRLTHMGAKVVFLKRFSRRSLSTREETARRQCVLESAYETLTHTRRSSQETTIQHFSRATAGRCGGELQDVSAVAIGPLPESSLEDWASVVINDPKPIYFELEKISKWFAKSWFQDPLGVYPNDLNGTALHQYFENITSNYCQHFFGGVCQTALKGCGFNSDCYPEHQNCVDALETVPGYKCVQKKSAGIVIVGGDTARCEAIGTNEPPVYPDRVGGNTLSLVGTTLYSCGVTSSTKVCQYLEIDDISWNLFHIPWTLAYHSAVTVANDIWFFTGSKLYVYHTGRADQKYTTYNRPFRSEPFSSCAVSNGSHTFVIHSTDDRRDVWLNKDASKPEEWFIFSYLLGTRFSFSCLWFGSEIFTSGGTTRRDGSSSISSVEVINVENAAVRTTNPLVEARRGHQMAVLHGKPAVLGGKAEYNNLNSIETFDEQTNSWVTMNDTLQESRSFFGLVQYRV